MKIKIHDPILDYFGKQVKLNEAPMTALEALILIINNPISENEVRTAEDKNKAFQLSQKLIGAKDEADLTVTECAYILDRSEKSELTTPLLNGRIQELLNEKKPEGSV